METMLFLALGMLTILLYRAERWVWLGLVLGLLTLTRPDGLFLAAALGLVELFVQRRLRRGFMLSAIIAIFVCAPWFGYLKWRTGHFLPTSAGGKQLGAMASTSYIMTRYNFPELMRHFPGLLYPALWIGYLFEFGLGGISLPSPKFTFGGANGSLGINISIWSFPAIVLILWLISISAPKFLNLRKWQEWGKDRYKQAMLILFAWSALHNLAYMLFLPLPGTASRYGAVNYIILWIAIVGGISSLIKHPRRLGLATAAILFVAACNTIYWNSVYDANLDHMLNVRIAAAYYIRDFLPSEERCAASDIGALRYFSGRPVIEFGGLIDPDAAQWYWNGIADEYLANHGATCLLLPGRTGQQSDGLLDYARQMKLDTSQLFDLELIKVFEIDHDRWLLGYLPTVNYQASVTIYRLNYK
jgi:hypothetical protein